MSLVQIGGGQAVVGLVGPLDHLVDARERQDADDRPEDLVRAIAMSSLTLSKIVGSTKKPLVPTRSPPVTSVAPCFWPSST